ncbi:TetR-like C-terminal domain-containing protein [Streptomyces galbus]|uniref:TetR/AcrR family transcriptional regulator n=1 Tax=Streptomyces galbus TaxID=33898 RepID=A0A4U5X6P6_STRGB|nr:TetR-like C-terminal domain-containing protein [Streptomyces galbus]TKT10570.1 TetR/AcrR family transcriptional regulator [Streptomyces galbus]GHD21889.1 transcriptional regulator [Streptomyces galbus]
MARAGLSTGRLVAAAADLADEAGFENVTLSALARRFGVKDASLYSHVRNIQDLRTRVALLAGGEMIEAIAAAVAGRTGKEALVAFAGAYRDYALRHPGRYAATQIRVDQELAASSPALRRTAEVTYGLLGAYGLTEPDLTDAVRLLRSTFHGYCALEAGGGFGAPRDVRASWDRTVDALHAALTHWPRDAGTSTGAEAEAETEASSGTGTESGA